MPCLLGRNISISIAVKESKEQYIGITMVLQSLRRSVKKHLSKHQDHRSGLLKQLLSGCRTVCLLITKEADARESSEVCAPGQGAILYAHGHPIYWVYHNTED